MRPRRTATVVLVGGYLVYVAACVGYLGLSVAQHQGQTDANIGAGLAFLALSFPWTPLVFVAPDSGLVYAVVGGAPVANLGLLVWLGRRLDRRADARAGPRRPV